ncbi:MAG: DNA primase [Eubacteriaceae bacterium]|nr:DNA primase [Eubacteriaceae bacterium]
MPYFTQDFINKVIDSSDIIRIVSRHTTLTRKGQRYWGLCPFPDHNEKTPSFSVKPEGFYYCFGCEKGGNVVNFVMEMNHLSFTEAIEFLANEANIPVEYDTSRGGGTEKRSSKKTIYEINRNAANYFYTNLMKNPAALKYLADRGIGASAVRTFGLGYSLPEGGLYGHLRDMGFKKEDILEASLARENSGKVYDYFRGRIMYPIQDVNDNIVGFGGRVMDKTEPKYLNSPENSVFYKRSMLYNLNRAKGSLSSNPIIIVEGYMDVISLYDKGIKTVCATLGTALGEKHASIIKRYTDNVILCYDGDNPGKKAALRGSSILENEGLNVKVLILPGDHDPDSYIRAFGTKAFIDRVAEAKYATDFKLDELFSRYDVNDINDRARLLSEAAETVSEVRDEVKWDYYAQQLSRRTDTPLSTVRNLIYTKGGRAAAGEDTVKAVTPEFRGGESSASKKELTMLRYIMQSRDNYERFIQAGGGNFFTGELGELYEEMEKLYSQGHVDIEKELLYNTDLVRPAALVSSLEADIPGEDVTRYVNSLVADMYSEKLRQIRKQIEDVNSTKDKTVLIQEQRYLKQKLIELKMEV